MVIYKRALVIYKTPMIFSERGVVFSERTLVISKTPSVIPKEHITFFATSKNAIIIPSIFLPPPDCYPNSEGLGED